MTPNSDYRRLKKAIRTGAAVRIKDRDLYLSGQYTPDATIAVMEGRAEFVTDEPLSQCLRAVTDGRATKLNLHPGRRLRRKTK